MSGGSDLKIGTPEHLFTGEYLSAICCGHSYDISPDGSRLVLIKGYPESQVQLSVVLNAFEHLESMK